MPEARTPILEDKRLWLSVATIVSLLLTSIFNIHVDPEVIAAIVAVVVGQITNSAVKEAAIAKAVATATGQARANTIVLTPKDVVYGPQPHPGPHSSAGL